MRMLTYAALTLTAILGLLLISPWADTVLTQIAQIRINNTTMGLFIDPPTTRYHNFGAVLGSGGFGIRENAGTIEIKDSGGAWAVASTAGAASVTSGITASTTQTQGQGALTTEFNEISTVANPDDVVTVPPAVAGDQVVITQHGSNRLQVFPASGDDLGYGVNVSTFLEENNSLTFRAHDATNWDLISSTQRFHAEVVDADNADAFIVTSQNAGGIGEFYHTNGSAAGDLLGWTFDPGGAGSSHVIASVADAGGGSITVTTSDAHDLAVDALITHDGTSDVAYNGPFNVLTVPTTTTYTVTAAFTATDTGTMQEAATLSPNVGYGGDYLLIWWASATSAANNQDFDFHIHVDTAKVAEMDAEQRFGTGTEAQSIGGGGILHVEDGEKVAFMVVNLTSAGNITLINMTVQLLKL